MTDQPDTQLDARLDALGIKYSLLPYQIPYLKQFLTVGDVRGRDVLEVGGALPREIVIDCLGSNSWTCTESPAYDEELGTANQQTIAGFSSQEGAYRTLLRNIEDFDSGYDGKFDYIFSIACFEHIAKFPQALDAMYRCLRPGGILFSMFSPLWSSHSGHHLYHIQIPERFARDATTPILLPWEHLLKNRRTLHQDLEQRFDRAFADELIYHTYNSPHINRYFTEDFVHIINLSKFHVTKMGRSFFWPMPEGYQAALERACPGYHWFDNQGMYLELLKK